MTKNKINIIRPPTSRLTKNNGWTIMSLVGSPYIRGYTHGILLKDDIVTMKKAYAKIVKKDFGVSLSTYLETIISLEIDKKCQLYYGEIDEEIRGITAGCEGAMSYIELIGWNHLLGMYAYYSVNSERCNAIMGFNREGDIVMGHSTHSDYVIGMIQPYVFYITPTSGHPFVMQSLPGYVFSGSDFFMSSSGIMGCETTIAKHQGVPHDGAPLFCRARTMMQYAETLEDCGSLLMDGNSGDYACIWLLGDCNKKMMMKIDLGREVTGIYYKNSGYFCSANVPETEELIANETNLVVNGKLVGNERQQILCQLMDHWDGKDETMMQVFSNKSLCAQEKRKRGGSSDVKVANSRNIGELAFIASWGSPCHKKIGTKN